MCSADESLRSEDIANLSQLDGQNIGALTGSSYEQDVYKQFPNSTVYEYDSYADMIQDLKNRRIAAYVIDRPLAQVQIENTEGLRYIDEPISIENYAYVLSAKNVTLWNELNNAIADMQSEGLLDALAVQWFEDGDDVVFENHTSTGRTLHIATYAHSAPFAYLDDGEIVGYDVDVIREAAYRIGYDIELTKFPFYALLNSVVTGKQDVAIGGITITGSRLESMLFSNTVYTDSSVAMFLDNTQEPSSLVQRIKNGIFLTLIEDDRWKLIVKGLEITLILSVSAVILGSLLGFLFSFLLRSRFVWIQILSSSFLKLLETLPLLIILLILYYLIFTTTWMPALFVGILGLMLYFSCTVANLLNAGIRSVDANQLQAASAMGYRPWQVFLKVSFPQAIHKIYPHYVGAVSNLIKETSIVGYITIADLTSASDTIRNITFQAFFPLILVAIIYFLIAVVFIKGMTLLMKHFDPKQRLRKIDGVKNYD